MGRSFDTVAIIGVGLLGGSLGLALRERGLAKNIRGIGRRKTSLDAALKTNAIDEAFTEIEPAVKGSDLVVICTPAGLVPSYLVSIQPFCSRETVVTDVASTKRVICEHARDTWPSPRQFVGSHPMAGSEKYGPEHADAGLYEGAVCFVEKRDKLDTEAFDAVAGLWESVGSQVIEVDPALHDELVAQTSHVPHVVAAALAQCVDFTGEIGPFVGKGFRDTTRIAAGRPEIWRDICLTNAEAVSANLASLIERLEGIRAAIESDDADRVDSFFKDGQEAHARLTGR